MLDDSIEIEVEIRDTYYYDSVLDNVNGECAVIKETHESFENLLRESVLENEATQKKRDAAKRFGCVEILFCLQNDMRYAITMANGNII